MAKLATRLGIRGNIKACAVALVVAGAAIFTGMISAPSIRAQAQTQSTATTAVPQEAAGSKMSFDVASVRPVQSMHRLGEISTSGPRLDMIGENVRGLIMYAYDLKNAYQLPQTPAITSVLQDHWYEIHAEAPGDGTPTKDEFRRMMQSLLADRFKLKIHHEMREMQVYELVVDKNGPKLKKSAPNATFSSAYGGVDGRHQKSVLTKATMEQLAKNLEGYAARPVVDKTGLTGTYDITFEATPALIINNDSEDGDISIFDVVRDQLGLKLLPQKAMIDIFVVDHVENPTAN